MHEGGRLDLIGVVGDGRAVHGSRSSIGRGIGGGRRLRLGRVELTTAAAAVAVAVAAG